jgi:hypothetical protein
MGLLYQFPAGLDEGDRVQLSKKESSQTLTLKTFGLPYLFWFYLAAIWLVILAMMLVIHQPLEKLMSTGDQINMLLGYSVWFILIAVPVVATGFFFYEKRLIKTQADLKIAHSLFFLPFFSRKVRLKDKESFLIEHFLDSPNMARLHEHPDFKKFQNRGYFELFALDENEKKVFIDRSSSKKTLTDLQSLLVQY